jgi:hypothetical protein
MTKPADQVEIITYLADLSLEKQILKDVAAGHLRASPE